MKRKLCSFLFVTALSLSAWTGSTKNASAESSLSLGSKSAYLMDADSKTEIFSCHSDLRLPIASMCKIMTLTLCFEAMDEGIFTFDTMIPVSAHASSMGGSQIFLRSGLSYPAKELMKSIAVCSANDSCVAMAEYIAGSDSEFVARMNERAEEIGASNTVFANCTGLPKQTQYSTAHDVAYMLKELISHEEYFSICSVWNEKFAHPDGSYTDMTNTNKLIRSYAGLDGGKTGYTSEAGFCFACTAKRGDMRAIAVVIGADSSAKRFADTTLLLDHAFANYTNKVVVDKEIPLNEKLSVIGGKKQSIQVVAEENLGVFSKKGKDDAKIELAFFPAERVKAPVKKGAAVGEIVVFRNGVEYARVGVVAFEGDEKASYFDVVKRVSSEWNF